MVDFKRFRDTTIDFSQSLTILAGRNGSGKSSVLSAVLIVLSWIIARLRNEAGVGQYITADSVNNHALNGCIVAKMFDGDVSIPNKARAGIIKNYAFDISPVKAYTTEIRNRFSHNLTASLPVFAFYGVARAVIDVPLRVRSHEFTSFDAYERCLDGAANFRSFFTWFRMCEDWENEQNARNAAKEHIEHPGLSAFRRAMSIFMPEYTDIHIRRHPLAMVVRKNDELLNVEQLSDGEKIYLALIGDLCHRLFLANNNDDPLLGSGIVLIDEIDLHLHPQWQSEITQRLTRTFPNIQFIVTTHSPHVLNRVPTQDVRMLEPDGSSTIPDYGYGMPSEVVLRDLMNLSDDMPVEISEQINLFYRSVNNDNGQARQALQMVESAVPQHPELPRMRKILERAIR